MNVLLVNVDCKWNLALRRMFAYYEQRGARVEMVDLGFGFYPHSKRQTIDGRGYDLIAVSNIFETNAERVTVHGCDNVIRGGVGSKNDAKLPPEIDATPPKYFDGEDTAHGFITRGCIRNCYFCKVPKHEGGLMAYRSVQDVVGNFKRAIFMDNNILAWDGANDAMDWLIANNIRCEFNQGLDLRLVNDGNLSRLARLNYMGEYEFAFDDVRLMRFMDEIIPLVKQHIKKPWKVKMFVYVNAQTMEPEDTVRRVEWLKAHECLPYVMRDANCYGSEYEKFYTDIAAWGNQPGIFKKMDFKEFLRRRHPRNTARQAESWAVYNGEMPMVCESCWQPTLEIFNDEENYYCAECAS